MSDKRRIPLSIRCTPLEISLADDLAAARNGTRHSILIEACSIGLRVLADRHGFTLPADTSPSAPPKE